ncbi:MAG: hypothetical protein PHH47_09110 [Gallionella sp.]|nr:hypothetical protein [Gallionella sp.]MDD4947308.1 hypothetical protein [Gallionella sp.]MDD5612790.1 hypothetical protein [Gallionella sp.]
MKSNKLAATAILLWLATIAVFAWLFVHGNTTAGSDGRTAILLKTEERGLVLAEMRGLLSATQAVLDGANQNDMKLVAKTATAAGMGSAADVNPVLMAKLPVDFKSLGMSVHHDMDEIAKAAEAGVPQAEILKMTSNTLTKCVACHSAWQLKEAN